MKNDYKYISTLLERYYNGTSSDEEEKELIDFFRSEREIPSEMEPDRRLFMVLDAEPGVPVDLSRKIMAEVDRRERRRRWRLMAFSGAAVLICVVFAASLYIKTGERMPSSALAEQQEVSSNEVLISNPVLDDSESESKIELDEGSKGLDMKIPAKKDVKVADSRKKELVAAVEPSEQEQEAMECAFKALEKVGRQMKVADDKLAIVDTKVDKAYSQIYDVINNLNNDNHEEY